MIDDFEEHPTARERSIHAIPIRHRSDFLPTAETLGAAKGSQVQFAFVASQEDESSEWPQRVEAQRDHGATSSKPELQTPVKAEVAPVIRVPRTATTSPCARSKPPKEREMTFSGLAVGCALGSAAAILLVLGMRALL